MNGSKTEQWAAIHEAGHAVLAHFLGIGLESASIVADENSAAHVIDGGEYGEEAEQLRLYAEDSFWLRMAIYRYAGAEAVRRYAPKSRRWKQGADDDYECAAIALEKITMDSRSQRLLQALAFRRCHLLVEHYWPEIKVLAEALSSAKTLSGLEAKKLIVSSLNKRRAGRLSW